MGMTMGTDGRRCLIGMIMVAVFAVATPAIAPMAALESGTPTPDRIVAVGDIHGAYDELVALLRALGIVGPDLAWSGGATTLVQTGDVTDRGAGVRASMDLLMRLQAEAPAFGGRVVVLLGNHEAMNLVGEIRDVTPEIMASFAGSDPTAELDAAFDAIVDTTLRSDGRWRQASAGERRQVREGWIGDRSAGYAEYLRAMGPDGAYGRWIRTLPVVAVINGLLFMHAGVAPDLVGAGWDVDKINARAVAEIDALDRYREHLERARQIPDFSTLQDLVSAAAREAGRLDWFEAQPREATTPPVLPGDLAEADGDPERFEAILRLGSWHLLSPEGPLWFRGLAEWSDLELGGALPGLLTGLGVRALVVAHTPQTAGIVRRSNGAVFLIDTGMLRSVYRGRAQALVIQGAEVTGLFASGQVTSFGRLPERAPVDFPDR